MNNILYVDSTAGAGNGDGASWANAHLTLQLALTAWTLSGDLNVAHDLIFVELNHYETTAATFSLSVPASDNQIDMVNIIRVDKTTGFYAPAWTGGAGGSGGGPVNFSALGNFRTFRLQAFSSVFGLRIEVGGDFRQITDRANYWEGCEIEFGAAGIAGHDLSFTTTKKARFVDSKVHAPLSSDCNLRVDDISPADVAFRFCDLSGTDAPADGFVLLNSESIILLGFDNTRLPTTVGRAIIDTASAVNTGGLKHVVLNRCQIALVGELSTNTHDSRLLHIDVIDTVGVGSPLLANYELHRVGGYSASSGAGMGLADRVETYSDEYPTASLYSSSILDTPKNLTSIHEPLVSPPIVGLATAGTVTLTVQIYSPLALTTETTWLRLNYRADATTPVGEIIETSRVVPGATGVPLDAGVGIAAWGKGVGFSYALSLTVTIAATGAIQGEVFHGLETLSTNAVLVNPKFEVS